MSGENLRDCLHNFEGVTLIDELLRRVSELRESY